MPAKRFFGAVSLASISIALLAPAARARDGAPGIVVSAGTRVRVEAIDGQFRPAAAERDALVSVRTLVSAEAAAGPLRIGGELLDARGYFQAHDSSARTGEINALEPVQAYVALVFDGVALARDSLRVQGGRYTLDIGSSRLIGRTDFPNTVVSYAGGFVDWRSAAKDRVVAFWGHPFTTLPEDASAVRDNRVALDRAGANVTVFGASATRAEALAGASLELYAYRLAEHDAARGATRNRHLATYGARLARKPKPGAWDFEAEGAVQRGTVRATSAAADRRDLTVRSGFVHAEAGYTLAEPWQPRVAVAFDYAGGDGPDANTYTRFDSLFGARRSDFGPTALYGPVHRANVIAPGVRLEMKPSKRLDLFVAVRGLWLAEAGDSFAATGVKDAGGRSGRHAGTQVEARARRWLVPERVRLEVGAAWLGKGRFLADAPNAPATGNTRYGYVELSSSF